MRTTLLSGVVAATLAATVGATAVAEPARAEDVPCEYVVRCPPPGPTATFAIAAMNLYHALARAVGEEVIKALVTEAIKAIFGARDEVVSHNEADQAAQSVSEANRFAYDYMDYDVLRQDWNLFVWAGNVYQSATRDYQFMLSDFTNKKAADAIGYALNVKYPMALDAGKDAGRSQAVLDNMNREYIAANELIVQKLAPTCTSSSEDPTTAITEVTYVCTAADGNAAYGSERYINGRLDGPAVNLDQLKLESAIHSSWLTAVQILPTLRNP
jgi:hypothetical protein